MTDPVPMRMNDATALKLLREIAADSARVIFTHHALQRMRQRKVSTALVLACLQRGIVAEPVALDLHGNWKLTVTHRAVPINLPNISKLMKQMPLRKKLRQWRYL